MLVDEERAAGGQRRGVQLDAIPVDVVGLSLGIAGERAPADGHMSVGCLHGDDAAVQFLTL